MKTRTVNASAMAACLALLVVLLGSTVSTTRSRCATRGRS